MRIQTIQHMVDAAIEHERQTDRVVSLLIKVTSMAKNRMSMESAGVIRDHCVSYVSLVPSILNESLLRARELGIDREMNFMLNELEAYWFLQTDLIPDKFGLIGIMDDAFASNYFIQTLSDFCLEQEGRSLINGDLVTANAFARNIIGDRVASQLESRISATIRRHFADPAIVALLRKAFSHTPGSETHPLLTSISGVLQFQMPFQLGSGGLA